MKQTRTPLRWLFPELDLFDTREEALAALKCVGKCSRRRNVSVLVALWLVVAAIAVFAIECTPAGNVVFPPMPRSKWEFVPRVITFMVAILPLLVLALLGTAGLVRRSTRRGLREQLSKTGFPICIDCGYDLTGNASGRCPECGLEFEGKHASVRFAESVND